MLYIVEYRVVYKFIFLLACLQDEEKNSQPSNLFETTLTNNIEKISCTL